MRSVKQLTVNGSAQKKAPSPLPFIPVKLIETGVSIALFLVALGAIVFVIVDLVHGVDEHDNGTARVWRNKLTSWRDRVAKPVPLTSIKIVIVAWQIITQVNDVFGTFLFVKGSPENLVDVAPFAEEGTPSCSAYTMVKILKMTRCLCESAMTKAFSPPTFPRPTVKPNAVFIGR